MLYRFFQPNVDQAVIAGGDFVRMKQFAASAGDLYESTQSSYAVAVGPESDFDEYTIAYWDAQQSTTRMSQVSISTGRPFLGRLNARNKQLYLPAQRPGRILFYPTPLWQSDYLPSGFNPVQDKIVFETPVLDVIQYFTPNQAPNTSRVDKTYEYDQLPFGLDDCFVLIPYYGRKYAFVKYRNKTDQAIDLSIDGLNWTITEDGPTITSIRAAAAVAAGAEAEKVITAEANGLFDYLQITFNPAAAFAGTNQLRVTVSDTVAG